MVFSKSNALPRNLTEMISSQGTKIECVASYKYLGILFDSQITFKIHIDKLLSKFKLKFGFYFRNRSLFSFSARKYLASATFLPLLDYGDLLYLNAYHSALRFITGFSYQAHPCTLYDKAELPSLYTRRSFNWYCFIYKSICGLIPSYLSLCVSKTNVCCCTIFVVMICYILRFEFKQS